MDQNGIKAYKVILHFPDNGFDTCITLSMR